MANADPSENLRITEQRNTASVLPEPKPKHNSTMNFEKRWNSRNTEELILKTEHVTLEDLKRIRRQERIFYYLSKVIPNYPSPVEFHISEVTHVTNKTRLSKIWESEGFKGFQIRDEIPLSWWSLKMNEDNINEAEMHYLDRVFNGRTQQQSAEQKSFLKDFTTSEAFENDISRFGNFQYTFPLMEMMDAYKHQICGGRDPVLRVYQTKHYSNLIAYVVLIHSPDLNEKFITYPELTSTSDPVAYNAGKILWKAQAICGTHHLKLILDHENKLAGKTYENTHEYYVWDNVNLAFHIDSDQILRFSKSKLKNSLSCCEIDPKVKLTNEYCSILDAKQILEEVCRIKENDK